MTDREKGPDRPPERIESPGTEDDKTRPFRTMESVDSDAPTVPMATRPDLKSDDSDDDSDEDDEEEGDLEEDEDDLEDDDEELVEDEASD